MEPGRLIAAGRGSQIFELGTDRVLRRSLHSTSFAYEANVMELARGFGIPVPAVHELRADDREIVMDRIPGPTMLAWMLRGPWRLRTCARILGEFHEAVHKVPGPTWLRDAGDATTDGPGVSLLHLDLHPLNIIMSPTGPVLIDWTNSARGNGATDVALTWLLLRTGEAPANQLMARVIDGYRGGFVRSYLHRVDAEGARAALPHAAELRLCDITLTDGERASIAELLRSVADG